MKLDHLKFVSASVFRKSSSYSDGPFRSSYSVTGRYVFVLNTRVHPHPHPHPHPSFSSRSSQKFCLSTPSIYSQTKENEIVLCVCVCDIILLNKSRGKWRQSAVDFLLLFIIVWRMEMSSLIIHKLTEEVLPLDVTFWCCWLCTVFCKLLTSHLSALVCVNYGLQHSQLVA
jgi:hypothetical protein